MKNKFIKIITIAIVAIASALTFSLTPTASANENPCLDICSNDCQVPADIKKASGCSGAGDEVALSNVVVNVLNAIIGSLAFVAVVFIIIGGIGYMTSQADASKVKKAKDTILYACIGLAVCAFAFAIVNFAVGIINNADSSDGAYTSQQHIAIR